MPDDQNEERAAMLASMLAHFGTTAVHSMTQKDWEAAWQARGAYEQARAQEMLGEIRACLDLLYSDRQYDVSRLAPELHKFAGPISIIDRLVNAALTASTSEGQG